MSTSAKKWGAPLPVAEENTAAIFWLRVVIVLATCGIIAMAVVAFLRSRKDHRALFDEQVQLEWIAGRDLIPAAEFFAQGGVFESRNIDGAEQIDQQYVVPLVAKLKEHHNLEVQAILDEADPKHAHALVALVPQDVPTRNAIRETVLETADTFPGLLYHHWGHEWLTIDFFDEQEIVPLQQAGVLQKLRASQRRME